MPEGKTAVTTGIDQTLRIWDFASGKARSVLNAHRSPVWRLSLSNDGDWAATSSKSGDIGVWDLRSGKLHGLLPRVLKVRDLAFGAAPDEVVSVSWDEPSFRRYRVGTGYATELGFESAVSVARLASGPRYALGLYDRKIVVRDGPGKETFLRGTAYDIDRMAFRPDGKRLAVVDSTGLLRVWNLELEKQAASLTPEDGVGGNIQGRRDIISLNYSPDGKRLALVVEGQFQVRTQTREYFASTFIELRDAETLALIWSTPIFWQGNMVEILDLRYSSDGRHLFVSVVEGLAVVQASDRRVLAVQPQERNSRPVLDVSPDGKFLALGVDSGIHLWAFNPATPGTLRHVGEELRQGRLVKWLKFSPDGRWLLSVDNDSDTLIHHWQISESLRQNPKGPGN